MPMEWTNQLSVGVSIFDNQHKQLIRLLNDYEKGLCNQSSSKERLLQLINGLADYVNVHFKSEENYMKKYNYPDYEKHKKTHDDFVKKVLEYKTKFESGKLLLSMEMANTIKDWITKHIMGMDKEYSKFFAQKGVK
jgi:hemerythrin